MQYPSNRYSSDLSYRYQEDSTSRSTNDVGTILIVHDIISSFTKIYYTGISNALLKRIAENFWSLIKEKEIHNILPTDLIKELLLKINKGNISADLFSGVLNMLYSDLASMSENFGNHQNSNLPNNNNNNTNENTTLTKRKSRIFNNKENELLTTKAGKKKTQTSTKTNNNPKLLKVKSQNNMETLNDKSELKTKRQSFKLFAKKKMHRTQTVPDFKTPAPDSKHDSAESPSKSKSSRNSIYRVNSDAVAEKILETMDESFVDEYFCAIRPETEKDLETAVVKEAEAPTTNIDLQDKEYCDLANYYIELKSKAKELGIELEENAFKDQIDIIDALETRLSSTPSLNTSLSGQWIVVRRLLTAKGGVKLKAPATIDELLTQAGQALKIDPCKVRDQSQTEITSLSGPNPPIVFITTKEEENLYFS